MPTARELLEQADALMRRNRAPAPVAEGAPTETPPIPELTDVAVPEAIAVVAPEADAAADQPAPAREALARELPAGAAAAVAEAPAVAPLLLDDIPELTEAIEEIEAPSILAGGGDFEFGEPSVFLGSEHGEASLFGPWPHPDAAHRDSDAGDDIDAVREAAAETGVLYVAPELVDEALLQQLPADALVAALPAVPEPGPAAPPVGDVAASAAPPAPQAPFVLLLRPDPPPPAPVANAVAAAASPVPDPAAEAAAEAARWATLAEEIRMQVLQRIDIFTDTGLQDQLALRLRPIVDRASADLVTTINQHLGQLLRAYVAEAIEREIEKWRAGDR